MGRTPRRTPRVLTRAGLLVGLTALIGAVLVAPASGGPQRGGPDGSCTPGEVRNLGPASEAAPIVTGRVVSGDAFTVTRGVEPPRLARTDLDTGQVTETTELPTGSGAWASTVAGETLWVGTYNPAHLYRYDTSTSELDKVAELAGEQFIMDAAADDSGRVYVGTYPSASVYQYDPATGEIRDYGSVAPGERYVRSIAVVGDTVYAGVGSHARLVALNTETGERTDLTPEELTGESFVYAMAANEDVVVAGTEPSGLLAIIDRSNPADYTIVETGRKTVDAIKVSGRTVYFTTRSDGALWAYHRDTGELEELAVPSTGDETRTLTRRGNELIGFAGSGAVWQYNLESGDVQVTDLLEAGHPAAPEPPQSIHYAADSVFVGGHWSVTKHDPATGETYRFRAPGEPKAMESARGRVYAAMYPSAQIWRFDPTSPTPTTEYVATIPNDQTRPRDMAFHPRLGVLAIGSQPDYGVLGGSLSLLDVRTGDLRSYRNIIKDQSISAVAVTPRRDAIFVGSEIRGGIGSVPKADEAHVAAFDPETEELLWEVAPVPDAPAINSMTLVDDRLVGVTTTGEAFALDPDTGDVLARADFGRQTELHNVDGTLYGVDVQRLSTIDPVNLTRTVLQGGLGSDWFTGPHLAADDVCGVYVLDGRDLTRVATTPHRSKP